MDHLTINADGSIEEFKEYHLALNHAIAESKRSNMPVRIAKVVGTVNSWDGNFRCIKCGFEAMKDMLTKDGACPKCKTVQP